MDDPWGSPWASAPAEERTPSPTKSDLEPPPRAFLSTTSSPRLPAVSVDSPWADGNDGLGDWAAADVAIPSVQSASGWGGGWGGADTPGAPGNQHLTPISKDEGFGFGQASPITWPGSIASPSSKNGHAFRQPSPDPWASELDDFREARDAQYTPRLVLNRSSTPASAKELEPGWRDENGGAGVDATPEGAEVTYNPADAPPGCTPATGAVTDAAAESDSVDRSRPSTSSNPRSSHSRSSSASRNDSDSDGARQDSPITSIDEDARSRLALAPRKVSGKIQVLVEKYDGLAKAAADESPPVRRESSVTPQKTIAPEEATDFGDFEDAQEAAQTPPTAHSAVSSPRAALEQLPTPHTPTRQKPPSATVTPSPHTRSPVVKQMPPMFGVDLAQVGTLFKDLQPDPPASRDEVESALPDNIITDTFTQISERKTWYRISRQGSSRMHNSGDTDSYRRVAWPTSTVHDETLKIVRRWMEQDSITGRTTLGGGGNRTNMFNWDSAAEPVALEQVFAKRRRQPRPTSLQQQAKVSPIIPPVPTPPLRNTNGAVTATTKQRPASLAGPVPAAFGWSSSPVEQPSIEIPQPVGPATAASTEGRTLEKRPDPVQGQSATPLDVHVAAQDEDDDWGEMISSPPVDAQPLTLPAFGGPDTEPLQTLVGGTTLPTPKPYITNGGQVAAVTQGSIEELWGLPPPERVPGPLPPKTQTSTNSASYFDQPMKPTVPTDLDVHKSTFTPTTPLAILSPLPVVVETPIEELNTVSPAVLGGGVDADSIVRRIVDNLPDLSYMLRR